MSLRYALLVALSDGPKTGYDVARYFDETVGFFWRATQSQIYRDLGKLRERSQVTSDVIEQSGKPNKVVFTITDEGRRTLLEWSRAPSDPPLAASMVLERSSPISASIACRLAENFAPAVSSLDLRTGICPPMDCFLHN